jgi:hypothetical protein
MVPDLQRIREGENETYQGEIERVEGGIGARIRENY